MKPGLFIAVTALAVATGCAPAPDPASPGLRQTRMMMGTVVTIEAVGGKTDVLEEALTDAWSEMARLEAMFSRYASTSEVSRINSAIPGRPVAVSPATIQLLSRARRIGELTEGGFDITLGPLLELWGFHSSGAGRIPSREEIKKSLASTGWSTFTVNEDDKTVTVLAEGVELDLSGMAKGFIADRGAETLRRAGIPAGLVNAGGDITCWGEKPGGGPWRIGLEDPRREGELLLVLEATEGGVATSGDYRNFFIHHRRRYSHIVDPRNGRPADTGVIEVSVRAPDCATADGLATGIFVLGRKEGLALLERLPDTEGVIVTLEEGEPFPWRSSGLENGTQ